MSALTAYSVTLFPLRNMAVPVVILGFREYFVGKQYEKDIFSQEIKHTEIYRKFSRYVFEVFGFDICLGFLNIF